MISYERKYQNRISLKSFHEMLHRKLLFQESGWLFFPGSSSYYWKPRFLVKGFRENFNVTSYLQKIPQYCKFNILFIRLKIAVVSPRNFKFQISCFLYLKTFKACNAFSLSTLYDKFLLAKMTIYIYNIIQHALIKYVSRQHAILLMLNANL